MATPETFRDRRVSSAELHARLNTPYEEGGGGFSVSEVSGHTPLTGHMASIHGHETISPGVASPEHIESYRRLHESVLGQPEHYYGGWVENQGTPQAETALDVSKRFLTRSEAHRAGRLHAQKAYYDLESGQSRDVHYGPRVPWNRQTTSRDEHRANMRAKNETWRALYEQHAAAGIPPAPPERRQVPR